LVRREFGRNLNVGQFLHDFTCAREVLDEALNSQDPRLLEYARYVEKRLRGPRIADTPQPPPPPTPPQPPSPPPPVPTADDSEAEPPKLAPAAGPTEAELRAHMLRNYTGGLR
jgi:hypothetical protein